jgi:hypothetical protein
MKSILILIVLFLFIHITEAQKYKPGQKAYSYALSELKIRDTSNVKGKLLDTIPFGQDFIVLPTPTAPVAFSLDGIPGHWIKVKYKNSIGFLFDGYSTIYPPPAKEGVNIIDYFKKNFTIKEEKTKDKDHPDSDLMITTSEGVMYIHNSREDQNNYDESILEFPGITIYDGFVFLLAYQSEIRGLTLNHEFMESLNDENQKVLNTKVDWETKKIMEIKELNLTLVKDKTDKLVKISVNYFYGAGYATLSVEELNGQGVKIKSYSRAD